MEYVGGGEGVVKCLSDWDSSRRACKLAIAAVRYSTEHGKLLKYMTEAGEDNLPDLPRFWR